MKADDVVGPDAVVRWADGGSTQGAPRRMQRMDAAFRAALTRHPDRVCDERYLFGGHPVRLRVVGTGFGRRTHRAFGHLRSSSPVEPLLTIDLWDETDVDVPGLADGALGDLERFWVACDGTITASSDGRYVSFRYRDSVTILDRLGGRMIGCRRNGASLSGGDHSKPLLLMLSIWYHDRGIQPLHAGLIACDGAGVVFPGESGTGKSTTSLAGLLQGLEFLGDDFIGLQRTTDDVFVGHSLFSTTCLVRENLWRFPGLRSRAVDEATTVEDKPILFLAELFPDRLRPSVPIRAVVLLRVGCPRTEIVRARRAEALRHFAASTLHTVVPRPGREALALMGDLVERVPAWWLHLGPDLSDVRPSIARIVA